MHSRRNFIVLSIIFFIIPFIYLGVISNFEGFKALPIPRVEGKILNQKSWDHFETLVILKNTQTQKTVSTLTSVNGYFYFPTSKNSDYILYKNSLNPKNSFNQFKSEQKVLTLKNHLIGQGNITSLPTLPLIGLLFSILYVFLGIILFKRVADKEIALLFLMLSFPPFWVNAIDASQHILAFYSYEEMAALLFNVKYLPLIYSAIGFFLLFLYFPIKQEKLLKIFSGGRRLLLPSFSLSSLFIISMILNNERVFKKYFLFDFSLLIKASISLIGLSILSSVIFLAIQWFQNNLDENKPKIKRSLYFLACFIISFFILVAYPVLFLNSQEFFPKQFFLFNTLGVFILFIFLAYAVFKGKFIRFEFKFDLKKINYSLTLINFILFGLASLLVFSFLPKNFSFTSSWHFLGIILLGVLTFQISKFSMQKIFNFIFTIPQKNHIQLAARASRNILKILNIYQLEDAFNRELENIYPQSKNSLLIRLQEKPNEFFSTSNQQWFEIDEETMTDLGVTQDIKKMKGTEKFLQKLNLMEYSRILCFAIWRNNQVEALAFISLSKMSPPLSENDFKLLETLKENLSIALLNSSLYTKLQETLINLKETQALATQNEKLASMGTLAAGLAHEIKNPLAGIRSYLQMFPQMKDDLEYIKEMSEGVPQQIDRVTGLVQNLLNYSQTKPPSKKTIDLNELLMQNIHLMKAKTDEKNIAITSQLDDKVVINSDQNLWSEIIINLLLNACDAIHHDKGLIKVELLQKAQQVQLIIEDNGRGIETEELPKIFTPFYSSKSQGTGLGLATVEKNILMMGGKIKVTSDLGQGTKFNIHFPVN